MEKVWMSSDRSQNKMALSFDYLTKLKLQSTKVLSSYDLLLALARRDLLINAWKAEVRQEFYFSCSESQRRQSGLVAVTAC